MKFVHLIASSTCTKLICAEHHCHKTFWRGSTYKRHLEHNHMETNDEEHVGQNIDEHENVADDENVFEHFGEFDDNQEPETVQKSETINTKDSVAVYVARLRNTGIPSSTLQFILNESKELVDKVVEKVGETLSPLLTGVRNGVCPTEDTVKETENVLEETKCIFDELGTEYKQNKYIKEKGVLVEPVEKQLGKVFKVVTHTQTGRNYQEEHNESFQMVPLKEVMTRYLEQPGVMTSILQHEDSDEESVLKSYRDGRYFKESFNVQGDETILPILLYSDDFETANPLGSRKGIHKLTAVYISFPCLGLQHQASLRHILLAALAPTKFVSKYGMDSILSPITQELLELERTGIQINSRDEYIGAIKPRLFQVTGDNLALNSLLGYVTSFVSNYYCRICKMHREHARKECKEDEALLRTHANYVIDSEANDYSATGIRRESVFNSLPRYHVTQNLTLDIMHDFLEGILPLELKLVLGEIFTNGEITIDTLNSRIQSFNYGFNDKKNRPS